MTIFFFNLKQTCNNNNIRSTMSTIMASRTATQAWRTGVRQFSMTARRRANAWGNEGRETVAEMEKDKQWALGISNAQGIAPAGFISGMYH